MKTYWIKHERGEQLVSVFEDQTLEERIEACKKLNGWREVLKIKEI